MNQLVSHFDIVAQRIAALGGYVALRRMGCILLIALTDKHLSRSDCMHFTRYINGLQISSGYTHPYALDGADQTSVDRLIGRGFLMKETAFSRDGSIAARFTFPRLLDSCLPPHDAEVFGLTALPSSDWEGQTETDAEINAAQRATPPRVRRSRSKSRDPRCLSEAGIQGAVIEHLCCRGTPGTFWFAVPNGGLRSKTEAAILSGQGVVAGIPDLILVKSGHVYALELKPPSGRLSGSQRRVQQLLCDSGAHVVTAFGLDAALEQLEDWQLLAGSL
jgi:hypothetical protein